MCLFKVLIACLGLGLGLSLVVQAEPGIAKVILPTSFGAWTAPSVRQVAPQAMETLAGDGAAILREYGLRSGERAVYASSGRQLTVTLYRMADPSAAYGAFTFLRTPDMAASDLAEKSAVGHDRALAVVGNLLLDIASPGAASVSDLKAFLTKLAAFAEHDPFPDIASYLPVEGIIANSDHYIVGAATLQRLFAASGGTLPPGKASDAAVAEIPGALQRTDWLGFADGAEAELARYRVRGEVVPLLLVRYPTRQLATKHMNLLGKSFAINPSGGVVASPAGALPTMFLVRKGSLVAIVIGTRSPSLASELFSKVQYETSLTWSEPTWKLTEKPFVQMLYDVFVGTGVILMYAAVASLAFGFVRLVIKRLLPNRVFDRPGAIEVLQLGIYSKPIESKDFYSGEPPS